MPAAIRLLTSELGLKARMGVPTFTDLLTSRAYGSTELKPCENSLVIWSTSMPTSFSALFRMSLTLSEGILSLSMVFRNTPMLRTLGRSMVAMM